ncbi:hypothetical protein DOE54_12935 [Vibrio cholerae]|nr:hypothetical protein [Vibrio cholerae]EGR1328710.1 hypothetical protein [Vibrio cholerae]EGR1446320.1 hypothetical protein [Vibrio cholerae]EGR2118486.1 hypothetical protein [Vibrio cholerae]EGR2122383.1 hypothetical protein [Vibrio cholerae]
MRFDVNLTIMKITHVDREVDSRSKMSFSAMYGSWRERESMMLSIPKSIEDGMESSPFRRALF